jgi:diguanylate cyclase (GGDEF)-like protein
MPSTIALPELKEVMELQLFRSVGPESIEGILERCTALCIQAGDILIVPGQWNKNLYLLLSGRMQIHLGSTDTDPIAYIERGEAVGEMSIIDQNVTSAYVVASEDCRLLVLEEQLVWSLVRLSHAAACNLLVLLTQRLRYANRIIFEKIQIETTYHYYGSIDALTGLHNRHWLDMVLARQLRRSELGDKPFSIIISDIDSFKQFNDKFGHLCGDVAIHTVARVMMDHLRPTEMAARYGGDEFIVLLPDVDIARARTAAERLRCKVMASAIVMPDGRTLPPLTISLGVTQAVTGQTAEDLIDAADAALYRAKQKGRNTISE